MNYFLKKKKWMAWVIMLTFLFTSIMPSNLMAGNSMAEAAPNDGISTLADRQYISSNGAILPANGISTNSHYTAKGLFLDQDGHLCFIFLVDSKPSTENQVLLNWAFTENGQKTPLDPKPTLNDYVKTVSVLDETSGQELATTDILPVIENPKNYYFVVDLGKEVPLQGEYTLWFDAAANGWDTDGMVVKVAATFFDIQKSVVNEKDFYTPGENVDYTIDVTGTTNIPKDATFVGPTGDITITDTLPTELELLPDSTIPAIVINGISYAGNYDSATHKITWVIPEEAYKTLTPTVTTDANGNKTEVRHIPQISITLKVKDDCTVTPLENVATVHSNAGDVSDKEDIAIVRAGSIEFTKTDDQGTALAGATFGLYQKVGNDYNKVTGVADVISGADGKVTFTNLTPDTYYVKEESAPAGYVVNTVYHPVTVIAGETVKLTVGFAAEGADKGKFRNVKVNPISVKKVWDDANNQDGVRPTGPVTIQVYATAIGLTAADLAEVGVVSPQIVGEPPLTLPVATVQVTGTSTADAWNTLNSADAAKLANLPATTVNGNPITYSIKELNAANVALDVNGVYLTDKDGKAVYTVKSYTTEPNGTFVVTNKHVPEVVSKTVTKVWEDNNNQDGIRPDSIEVQLLADGVAKGDAVVLNAANGWSYTWSDLDVNAAGEAIVYTVAEISAVAGYETTVNGFVITNTHIPETTEISGVKTWVDNENAYNTRPKSITVNLLANDVEYDFATVTAKDNWNWSFRNLPKYENGEEIIYTIEEVAVDGYTTEYVEDSYDIINTIAQDTVDVTGEKIWKVPTDVEIPESITVKLFQDKVEYARTTVSAVDWTFAFNDLPKYDLTDGHMYDYTVEEVDVPGFESTVVPVGDNEYEFNIVNTFIRDGATTNVTVQKLWNDLGANVTTHSAITVDLYQNGVKYETVELNDETGWNWIFEGLPKYDANQQPYKYTVQEQPIAGYTGWVSDPILLLESGDIAFVIENTLILGKPGEITVTKQVTGDKRPPADTKFQFELQIEVTRPAGTNVLFEASALADLTLDEAAIHLNDTISGLRAEAMLTTGSQYQYEYLLTDTDKENEFAEAKAVMAMDVTSPSAIIFEENDQFVVELDETEDYEMKVNLLDAIVEVLNDLSVERAQDLTDETMEDVLVDIFEQLAAEVPMPEGCTMALDKGTVESLIVAAIAYDNALNSYEDGHQPIETTTPSALQVFMNGKAVTPSALIYVEDGGYYKLAFELADGESAIFNVQATTGSAIRYNIVEHLTDATSGENYIGTDIVFGVDGKVDGTVLGWTAFDESQVMGYTVVNKYKNNEGGGGTDPEDPWTPWEPIVPPEEEIPDPDVPLVEPPVEEIPEPDVPLIDVPGEEVEIPTPEVPLGDAPKTGDTNNAVPFVVLMMLAVAGLGVTRRKFN